MDKPEIIVRSAGFITDLRLDFLSEKDQYKLQAAINSLLTYPSFCLFIEQIEPSKNNDCNVRLKLRTLNSKQDDNSDNSDNSDGSVGEAS